MPVNVINSARIVHSGALDGSQPWSTGFWLYITPAGDFINASQLTSWLATVLRPLTQTWWTAEGGVTGEDCALGKSTAYYHTLATGPANVVAEDVHNFGTGSGPSLMPRYCSLVASFHSAFPGRRGRGRAYLPLLASGSTVAGGKVATSVAAASAAAWANYFTAINASDGTADGIASVRVVTVSKVVGLESPVVSVSVDNVPDTQHRRTGNEIGIKQTVAV